MHRATILGRMTLRSLPKSSSTIFALDALLSTGLGLVLLTLAAPLHALASGGLAPGALRLVGLVLIPWGAHNWLTSRKVPLGNANPLVQIAGDSLWIVLSLVVCSRYWVEFSLLGKLLYAPQIALVALILVEKVRVVGLSR